MGGLNISFASNPGIFIIALIAGTVPSVLWLIFWLREDEHGEHEPLGLIALTFIAGMVSVVLVLPIEKFISGLPYSHTTLIVLWAASEEFLKYAAFIIIMNRSPYLNEPVDYAVYLMTAGLGFAALENAMYLIHPVAVNDATVSFLTGNLRFLGSTLLHSIGCGIVGLSIGLAFFKPYGTRVLYTIVGLGAAITLHSVFNFFIMQQNGQNFLQVFGFLWVVTIILMLLFEKLRRMGSYVEPQPVQVPTQYEDPQ